ncbi:MULTISPECIES: hypothetical protein [unclassified Spirosoma]|uniref:hypothetical protein n=1 Tax=unclassified Spirosoma TaxID=2621999 RepID=UPI00095C8AAF|nr:MULTISPECIES: hypothetical protein [unclassified Spirosoma]MBN8821123.1 hypothetical protein [Spirosoma sp.]OJW79242.1 MAG: hypothetical protein BGO59_11910 [Spirosoma sp. 48-14]
MATPYQLAALSEAVYQNSHPIGRELHPFADGSRWTKVADAGVMTTFSGFYAAKFECNGEKVIAYRGSDGTDANDWIPNLSRHLISRESDQVEQAKHFLAQNRDATVLTGHSLGGFLACTMAFHFTVRVCSFNAPWPASARSVAHIGATVAAVAGPTAGATVALAALPVAVGGTLYESIVENMSQSFRGSALIVYQSSTDAASFFLPPSITQRLNNIIVRPLGPHGLHPIPEVVSYLSRVANFNIHWPRVGTIGFSDNKDYCYIVGFVCRLCLSAEGLEFGDLELARAYARRQGVSETWANEKFNEGFSCAYDLIRVHRIHLLGTIERYYSPPLPAIRAFQGRSSHQRLNLVNRIKRFLERYPYVNIEDGWRI